MATVNKASLRSEFDALKARFESLRESGGMGDEARALFDALLMLFELLMAVFMERGTPKGSRNSGTARQEGFGLPCCAGLPPIRPVLFASSICTRAIG